MEVDPNGIFNLFWGGGRGWYRNSGLCKGRNRMKAMLQARVVHVVTDARRERGRTTGVKGNAVGFLDEGSRPYLLGFANKCHADLTVRLSNAERCAPLVLLSRGARSDIGGDVNEGLRRAGAPSLATFGSLVIDVDAKVTVVTRRTFCTNDPTESKGPFDPVHVSEHRYDDFILLPVERNLGVVVANDLVAAESDEGDGVLTFRCHVIDPADNPSIWALAAAFDSLSF